MNKKNIISIVVVFVTMFSALHSQVIEPELFIIDAFVTPETPHIFNLSYFTSVKVRTKVIIDEKYTITISEEFIEDHSAEIDFTNYSFDEKFVPFQIISEMKNGEFFESEIFEIILPYDEFIETKEGDNPISTILFGVFLYLLPSPNILLTENDNYFSLTKELPIVTFYSSGYNYPSGNIVMEYTHVYEPAVSNFFRLGYKHFIPIDIFEYVSPGLTGFTNFNGFNGIGGEISLGLFKFYDVFTLYSRYRYNMKPSETKQYFHEISIGLYSHFFTINL